MGNNTLYNGERVTGATPTQTWKEISFNSTDQRWAYSWQVRQILLEVSLNNVHSFCFCNARWTDRQADEPISHT